MEIRRPGDAPSDEARRSAVDDFDEQVGWRDLGEGPQVPTQGIPPEPEPARPQCGFAVVFEDHSRPCLRQAGHPGKHDPDVGDDVMPAVSESSEPAPGGSRVLVEPEPAPPEPEPEHPEPIRPGLPHGWQAIPNQVAVAADAVAEAAEVYANATRAAFLRLPKSTRPYEEQAALLAALAAYHKARH